MTDIVCISPIDGREVARRQSASHSDIDRVLKEARAAQKIWRDVPLAERMAKLSAFVSQCSQCLLKPCLNLPRKWVDR